MAPNTDDSEDVNAAGAEGKGAKRRRSTAEIEADPNRRLNFPLYVAYIRLSKRVRALEESATETGNARTEEFIGSLNALLSPFGFQFGEYSNMEFFIRSNSETSDRALDVWKNFLWEWSTERALPFETNYKHKYYPRECVLYRSTSHVADTLLFERAALPSTNRTDPDHIPNGSFEAFSLDVAEEGLHLGQCAVRWLQALTISSDSTYATEPWAREFLDVATSVAIMYEESLLDRVKGVLTDSSFQSAGPIEITETEVCPCVN